MAAAPTQHVWGAARVTALPPADVQPTLADRVEAATAHEAVEQEWLRRTADFVEGNSAMAERRQPNFTGN